MSMNVDASTTRAAQLFSTSTFTIPDFQREYSWGPDGEVEEFWRDLHGNIDSPPYFLGLLIVTDEDEQRVVVDGQQRITTLTLLANSIRKQALAHEKTLIADSMRDVFLFHLDYDTEVRIPRIQATADRDRNTLVYLLEDGPRPASINPLLVKAQTDLDLWLATDLKDHEPGARLARWARFLSNGLTFALFEHPNRNSAYKVYEVVNTRGRDLTPAELIKSYLISRTPSSSQRGIYERWSDLEAQFLHAGAIGQFTQFVRHAVTLEHGYVLPRDLYQVITESYVGEEGVELLLCELEEHLNIYMQMVDPGDDDRRSEDYLVSSFAILHSLGLRTVRPIFLAAASSEDPQGAVAELIRVIVPRLAMGTFGTGSIERRFAEDAAILHRHPEDWRRIVDLLRIDLAPTRKNFTQRIEEANLPKGLLHVLRSSVLEGTSLPTLPGYIHQVRPKNAEEWPGFDDIEYRRLGGTIGNSILLVGDRRPRNTNTLEGAIQRLFPSHHEQEDSFMNYDDNSSFSAEDVVTINLAFASRAGQIWYAEA